MNRIVKANIITFHHIFKLKHFASFDCSSCKKKIQNPECKACHKMVSYFNIFAIPEQYEVNEKLIKQKAKDLQKQFHPDKNIKEDNKQKFEQYSAYINNAKVTLLDDLKRAQYIMELKGINVDEESKIDDSEFTMSMFELQEEIQETNDAEELKKLNDRLQKVLNQLKEHLEQFFGEEDLEKCKQFIFKYKYFSRAIHNVKQKIN